MNPSTLPSVGVGEFSKPILVPFSAHKNRLAVIVGVEKRAAANYAD